MELIINFVNVLLHLDKYLVLLIENYGMWVYLILFLIVFCETGLVVTPFLPGDSLIFVVGTLAAAGSLNIIPLFIFIVIAAILGDTVNYWIGNFLGPETIQKKKMRFIKKEYIERTEKFYAKYGGKTIILARFVPIIRTFAPFMAGVGTMTYSKFILYNITGGIAWVSLFMFGGYFFGNIPRVKENFTIVIFMIILISIIPIIYEYIKSKKANLS
ncbi:MAG: DedA family protein [Elusimicrobia bacterium]|nr:DedA family protein [Elusimicrobiota bacterium]